MHRRQPAENRIVADLDVAAEGRHVRQDDLVADAAIVRHMRIGHQKIVVADAGHAFALHRAAVHGHEFPDHVPVADLEPGRFALVLLVLRSVADRCELVDLVLCADAGRAVDDHMGSHPGARADAHARPNDAERSDLGARRDFRLRRYHRARIDHPSSPATAAAFASGGVVSGATKISADATS